MATFPPEIEVNAVDVPIGQDSSKFSVTHEDKTIRSQAESGYEYTRKRHTRAPRRIFKTGFTNISNEAKEALEAFQASVHVGVTIFEFVVPTSGETVQVRLVNPMSFKYMGIEGLHLWDVDSVEMKEV